jgi:hypothetical protein
MDTIYDWVAMILFGIIAIIFLQRSVGPARESDKIYHYLPPALCCAASDYLGNHGEGLWAIILAILVVGYVLFVIKPLDQLR